MTSRHAERVRDVWAEMDDDEASTELLFALVRDRVNAELGTDYDDGDIAEALVVQ